MTIAIAIVLLVTYIGVTKKPPDPPVVEMPCLPPLICNYVELPPIETYDDSEWTDPMEISGYSSDSENSYDSTTETIISPLRL